MLKKIIIASSVVLTLVLIYAILSRKPQDIKLTIIPQAHSFVSLKDEEEVLKFTLMINQKDTYVTNLNRLKNAYISDLEENNLYPIIISKINYLGNRTIKQEVYFDYAFYFSSKSLEDEFFIEKAYLLLEYDVTILKVKIGSFSSFKVETFNSKALRINYLKGIVNPYEDKKILVGFIIGFKNDSNNELIIESIKPLNNIVCVNYCEPTIDIPSAIATIEELVNYEINNVCPYTIEKDVQAGVNFLCTIGYRELYEIDTLAFKIDYRLNNRLETMFFAPFTFYKDHEQAYPIKDLIFYTLPHD